MLFSAPVNFALLQDVYKSSLGSLKASGSSHAIFYTSLELFVHTKSPIFRMTTWSGLAFYIHGNRSYYFVKLCYFLTPVGKVLNCMINAELLSHIMCFFKVSVKLCNIWNIMIESQKIACSLQLVNHSQFSHLIELLMLE